MFTKEEFDLTKRLYLPLKVIEICKEHDMEVEFKKLGREHVFFIKEGNLTAGMVMRCDKDEEILYGIEKMISYFEYELKKRRIPIEENH